MSLQLSKPNRAMILAAASVFNGKAANDFVRAVEERIENVGDPLHRAHHGHRDHSANHVRAAISQVLARAK